MKMILKIHSIKYETRDRIAEINRVFSYFTHVKKKAEKEEKPRRHYSKTGKLSKRYHHSYTLSLPDEIKAILASYPGRADTPPRIDEFAYFRASYASYCRVEKQRELPLPLSTFSMRAFEYIASSRALSSSPNKY